MDAVAELVRLFERQTRTFAETPEQVAQFLISRRGAAALETLTEEKLQDILKYLKEGTPTE